LIIYSYRDLNKTVADQTACQIRSVGCEGGRYLFHPKGSGDHRKNHGIIGKYC